MAAGGLAAWVVPGVGMLAVAAPGCCVVASVATTAATGAARPASSSAPAPTMASSATASATRAWFRPGGRGVSSSDPGVCAALLTGTPECLKATRS